MDFSLTPLAGQVRDLMLSLSAPAVDVQVGSSFLPSRLHTHLVLDPFVAFASCSKVIALLFGMAYQW